MKSSARKARRKWPCTKVGYDKWPIAMLAYASILALALPAQAGLSGERVPLPLPRPPQAQARPMPPDLQAPAPAAAVAAPPASVCRMALTDAIAIAPSIPDITGDNGCGGEDMVRLEAVVLPEQGQVSLKPAAVLRCDMAMAVADWVRTDVAAMASGLGTRVSGLDSVNSYECRGRNRVKGAKVSEHGRGNAIDLRGIQFANGQTLALTEVSASRALREQVLGSMCARFNTVLGPGSDGYHEDHIHIDLAPRRNNYKICEWMVWDALPQVAPLLPAYRPAEAPPREVAAATPQAPVAAPAPAPAPADPPAAATPPAPAAVAPVAMPVPVPVPAPRTARGKAAIQTAARVLTPPSPPAKPRKTKRRSGPVMPWDFLR